MSSTHETLREHSEKCLGVILKRTCLNTVKPQLTAHSNDLLQDVVGQQQRILAFSVTHVLVFLIEDKQICHPKNQEEKYSKTDFLTGTSYYLCLPLTILTNCMSLLLESLRPYYRQPRHLSGTTIRHSEVVEGLVHLAGACGRKALGQRASGNRTC